MAHFYNVHSQETSSLAGAFKGAILTLLIEVAEINCVSGERELVSSSMCSSLSRS